MLRNRARIVAFILTLCAATCSQPQLVTAQAVTPRCPYSSTGTQPMPVYRLDWYGYIDFNALRYAFRDAGAIPLDPCNTKKAELRMPTCGARRFQNVSNGTAPDCGRNTVLV